VYSRFALSIFVTTYFKTIFIFLFLDLTWAKGVEAAKKCTKEEDIGKLCELIVEHELVREHVPTKLLNSYSLGSTPTSTSGFLFTILNKLKKVGRYTTYTA
jgi:hypothetical protein